MKKYITLDKLVANVVEYNQRYKGGKKMRTLTQQELQEQKILSLELKIRDLEIDIKYYENKINNLIDEIILLEVENTQLKRIIKELKQ